MGFSRRTSCFPVSSGGLAYGTLDQCVSLSLIDVGGVLLPAYFPEVTCCLKGIGIALSMLHLGSLNK